MMLLPDGAVLVQFNDYIIEYRLYCAEKARRRRVGMYDYNIVHTMADNTLDYTHTCFSFIEN